MKFTSFIIAIALFIGITGCSKNEENKNNNKTETATDKESKSFSGNTSAVLNVKGMLSDTEIPMFSWINEKNREINLSDFKGKVIIINFWATWCGPCKSEIPDFVSVYHKYKNQGLEIIGVSLDSELSLDELAQFSGSNDITYQIIHDNGDIQNAFGGIKAIPTTYIIGKDFKVKNHFVGALTEEQLEKLVKQEL